MATAKFLVTQQYFHILAIPPSRSLFSLLEREWYFKSNVKHPPPMQDTWVQSLGQKNPLEKGVATHFSILAWKSPWTEEPCGYSPWGCKELDTTEWLMLSHFSHKWCLRDLEVKLVVSDSSMASAGLSWALGMLILGTYLPDGTCRYSANSSC